MRCPDIRLLPVGRCGVRFSNTAGRGSSVARRADGVVRLAGMVLRLSDRIRYADATPAEWQARYAILSALVDAGDMLLLLASLYF